jgi:hypothetical protein
MASPTEVTGAAQDESRSSIDWQAFRARMANEGPDGRLLCAITGEETDAELREVAIQFTCACPTREQRRGCPFRTLQTLYHVSAKALISSMTRAALLSLFELECEVRNRDRVRVPPEGPKTESAPLAGSLEQLRQRLLAPR